MINLIIPIIILFIFFVIYFNSNPTNNKNKFFNFNEKFNYTDDNCFIYGDNYNLCYSNPKCTIGFLPNGSTYCMKKFLQEDT